MKKHLLSYSMLTVIICLLIFLLVIQNGISNEKDVIIFRNLTDIESNELTIKELIESIISKDLIIKNKDFDIKKIIENAEIMIALSPLRELISDDEIEELMYLIPNGNPFRTDFQITGSFGESIGYKNKPRRNHGGTDLIPIVPEDMEWTITPLASGEVVSFGDDRVHGKNITIEHSDRVRTRYSHLEKIYFSGTTGRKVNSNSAIGYMGNSGQSNSPHAHVEIHVLIGEQWIKIDPRPFLVNEP